MPPDEEFALNLFENPQPTLPVKQRAFLSFPCSTWGMECTCICCSWTDLWRPRHVQRHRFSSPSSPTVRAKPGEALKLKRLCVSGQVLFVSHSTPYLSLVCKYSSLCHRIMACASLGRINCITARSPTGRSRTVGNLIPRQWLPPKVFEREDRASILHACMTVVSMLPLYLAPSSAKMV